MLDKLTRETFEPLKSQCFQLSLGDRAPLALELAAVLGNGLKGAASREQFSLHFRGPHCRRCRSGSIASSTVSSAHWISSWCRSPAMPRG